jgi:hypothetical protein
VLVAGIGWAARADATTLNQLLAGASCYPVNGSDAGSFSYNTAGKIENGSGSSKTVICAGHHGNIYPSAPTYSATVVLGSATGATCVLRAVYTDGTVAYSDSDTLGGGNSLALNVTTSQTDPVTINVRCALPAGADLVSISYSVSY